MCGIAGIVGPAASAGSVRRMLDAIAHRGPDDEGVWSEAGVALGSRRLAILDLSPEGHMPMVRGDKVLAFNGEAYNYLELAREMHDIDLQSRGDTEVVLHQLARSFDNVRRIDGMFALAFWDRENGALLLARDRFGEKPLYHAFWNGSFYFASEVKALAAAGVPIAPDEETWSVYLAHGAYDHDERTFFAGISQLRAGHVLRLRGGQASVDRYHDVAASAMEVDARADDELIAHLSARLREIVRLRMRSDVPLGICVSGGLDSALLYALVRDELGPDAELHAFHFNTGDERYDETPYVRALLGERTDRLHIETIRPDEIPALADDVAWSEEAPFGGIPTLAMARVYAAAHARGVKVLLDGQGVDEAWAGYDHYARADPSALSPVQGSSSRATRPDVLSRSLAARATKPSVARPFGDDLRDACYRDLVATKIPRALRFGDRASMRASVELRSPFLAHELVELGLRQPRERLIRDGTRKWAMREAARRLLPARVREAPKRPVQTPQREWLRGEVRAWAESMIFSPELLATGWFDEEALRAAWKEWIESDADNSFPVWQWISVTLTLRAMERMRSLAARA